MPSRRSIERTPERPSIRPSELSAADRACIERLVGHTLALVEREFILQTLRDNQGNRTRSARLLAISIRSVHDKIRSYRDQGEGVPEPRIIPLAVHGRPESQRLSSLIGERSLSASRA